MLAKALLVMATLMVFTVGQWIAVDQTTPFFRDFSWHRKNEWVGRITAGIAQIAMILFGVLDGPASEWMASTLIGFTLHDVIHLLIYETDVVTYLHHVVTAAGLGLMKMTMTPDQIAMGGLGVIILESTTPLLHVTWLLKQAGHGSHPLFKYFAGMTAALYGIMRLGVLPWVMTKTMDRAMAFVFFPFLLMSVYWFWKIVKMMLRVLESKEPLASSSEQSHES
jgi:hypothetical protein